jgi:hypothetical protein
LVRAYTPSDYKDLEQWWKDQNWDPVPPSILPDLGFIVPGVAAGFLYTTNSTVAWMEWIVANPKKTFEIRDEALNAVLKTIESRAKELGFSTILISTSNKRLLERLVNSHNYVIADKSMTNLARQLI